MRRKSNPAWLRGSGTISRLYVVVSSETAFSDEDAELKVTKRERNVYGPDRCREHRYFDDAPYAAACVIGSDFTDLHTAAVASRRVESNVGNAETSLLSTKGSSVQPKSTASQPCS